MKHRTEPQQAGLPCGGALMSKRLSRSRLRFPNGSRVTLLLLVLLIVLLSVVNMSWLRVSPPSVHKPPVLTDPVSSADRANVQFKGIDESVLPPVVIQRDDQVCALCTDGLVYVHVGRPAHATEAVSAVPVRHTVTEVMRVRPGDAPTFSAGRGAPTAAWPSSSEVVSRCLAQLISLGQIGAAQDEAVARSGADPRVSAAVLVDYDAAGAGTLVGRAGQCPAFLTEVRPVAAPAGARMDVSYPRLPSWPLRPTGGSVPPYFGTARVRETDVDRDVQPPVSVELTGDRSGVVMRFGRDETSTTPEPFEMVCPSHFLSVFIGRFGRQHNQLQEVMHTLALARRVNRTFIVPVLVPETYIPFLRYDAQRLYGFNALRREGRYCLVSYAEARRMLKELEAQGEPMSLRRFNYYADPRPGDEKEWWSTEDHEWFEVPSPSSSSGARWFNVDAWLEDSKAREPPVTTTRDARPDGMRFFETEEDFTLKDVFPSGGEDEYVRMALMRKTIQMIAHLMGGDHRSVDGATPQPRLGVLTSRMAFYVHPSLREQTLLMGLLRPSEAISREADRLYARYAARLSWPTTGTELRDTLRTGNFKNVIGFHIRRREGTCRREGVIIDRTAYAIDPRFQLERVDPSWSGPLSTLRNMELDCALTKTRVVELYGQYVRWMRSNMTADPPASAPLVPTIYMAYDDQSGPIAEQVDDKLVEMAQSGAGSVMWGSAAALPPRFVASYDVRISGDFMSMYQAEAHRLESEGGSGPPRPKFDEPRRVKLVHALHSRAFTEMFGVAFDFFMLTNMGVFRGVMLSSVSTNVIMRRWGRGLPCHGVMAGYQKSFYTAMWV